MGEGLDARQLHVLKSVEECGWSAQLVEAEGDEPGYEYTAGFMATLGHPEIVVFGLPPEVSHDLLWGAFRAVEAGGRFSHGERTGALLVGFECAFLRVGKQHESALFPLGVWHHHHAGVELAFEGLQLVWPDRDGLFPFDAASASRDWRAQPLVGEMGRGKEGLF